MLKFEEEEEFIRNPPRPLYRNFGFLTFISVILSGIVLFVLLVTVLTNVRSINTFSPSETSTSGTISTTTGAPPVEKENLLLRELSQNILGAMDFSANPCADFYQYSCGRWISNTQLTPEKYSITKSFTTLVDENALVLKQILESHWPVLGPFYNSCMNLDMLDSKGVQPIAHLLSSIDEVNSIENAFQVLGELHSNKIAPFFQMEVDSDFLNPDMNLASLSQGGLGLPSRDYYFSTSASIVALRNTYVNLTTNLFVLSGASEVVASQLSRDSFSIELAIASSSFSPEQMRDPNTVYHKMSLTQLQQLSPGIPWTTYFNSINASVSQINIQNPNLTRELSNLITMDNLPNIKTYLKSMLLWKSSGSLSKPFRDVSFAFTSALYGVTALPERWKICSSLSDSYLGDLLGRYFVQLKFPGDSKRVARQLVAYLQSAFHSNLEDVTWMDAITRDNARIKLNKIINKIGYPDSWESFDDVVLDPNEYLANVFALRRREFAKTIQKIGTPVDKSAWGMTPATVNAYYNPTINEIVFPAAILQPPFFNSSYPEWANFAAIGAVIGHEITHGFDDTGRQFDENGYLRDWWTSYSATNFQQKAQCVVDAYDSYEVLPGLYVNGELTEGENLADIGGLRIAYKAYKNWTSTMGEKYSQAEISKYFPGMSIDQLFFVTYGQVWCEKDSDDFARWLTLNNEHPVGKYRVVGATSNNEKFWDAFSCPQGTTQHPQNACKVW